MIQIKKYLAQIRLVFSPRNTGDKTALSERDVHTHESSWAGHNLPPRSGHVASVPTSSSGPPCTLGEVTGEKHQVSAFPSTEGLFTWEIQSQKALARRYKVKMTHCGNLVTAWHILVAGPCIHGSVTSKKLVNYLNSLT